MMMNDTFDNCILSPVFGTAKRTSSSAPLETEDVENEPPDSTTTSLLNASCNKNNDCQISLDDSLFFASFSHEVDSIEPVAEPPIQSQPLVHSTPKNYPSDKTSRDLVSWGLPQTILDQYKLKKITKMFPWQVECLSNNEVLHEHRNLVYSAPTSAGKTLVAEILAIKTTIERRKKVIFILPFVSVVREKMFYFQEIFCDCGIRVDGFMGSYNPPGGFKAVQVAICTIEKANNLINKMLIDSHTSGEDISSQIGAVIIDEMHLLGDTSRGYLLELLLTKLKYISLKHTSKVQIIGMSATLPNLQTMADWLDAHLYVTQFRPIPLREMVLVDSQLFDSDLRLVRSLDPILPNIVDSDNILHLCLETIIDDTCSVLIFCPTKNWCESLALQISSAFNRIGREIKNELSCRLRAQIKVELITELLQQLKMCPVGLDKVLKKTVAFGVGFHHAGLTLDERDILESAFKNNALRVLVATSTLSSGVNLPARRVIIRTPTFHAGKPIDVMTYKQMTGRAGRMGRDMEGESILITQKNNVRVGQGLIKQSTLEPVTSCLDSDIRLRRAILEIVASGFAASTSDIRLFVHSTLLAIQQPDLSDTVTDDVIDYLTQSEFIKRQNNDKYIATALGKACLQSSIPPDDALALLAELQRARRSFVLDTELHLIYHVTPYSACYSWSTIDWMLYLNLWVKLAPCDRRVADLVGVKESFIVGMTRAASCQSSRDLTMIHRRFFVALALQDLVNEVSLADVSAKFGCNRGLLQSLQMSAATFAGMVTSFSRHLGWSTLEVLIEQFQDRLQFGVARDLLDLMRLPVICNGRCARILYNGGIETLIDLANCDCDKVENILQSAIPFESEANNVKDKFRNVWISGKPGLTEREAARILVNAARKYLEDSMGFCRATWKSEGAKDGDLSEVVRLGSLSLNDTRTVSSDVINTSQDESPQQVTSSRKRQFQYMSLIESPLKRMKLNAPSVSNLTIIDVCRTSDLFSTFCQEVGQQKVLALSVACVSRPIASTIGTAVKIGHDVKSKTPSSLYFEDRVVTGFAFVFGPDLSAYYVDLNEYPDHQAPTVDLIKSLVRNVKLYMFDSKEQIKVLSRCCRVEFDSSASVKDPKVADWILEPEGKEKNLHAMVTIHCSKMAPLVQMIGPSKGLGSISSDLQSSRDPKLRACVESICTYHLVQSLKEKMRTDKVNPDIYDVEMGCLVVLAKMELTGIGVSQSRFKSLTTTLREHCASIEKRAFSLAGRRFSLSSSKEVAKVTGRPVKQNLTKHDHPISKLVLQWRKINYIMTNGVRPLVKTIDTTDSRIHGRCDLHTATGRVTMHEPNLQNVPKTFDLSADKEKVTVRDCFVARDGHVLISADYCQLELRLLAHLSRDQILRDVIGKGGDIFRAIAAKWNNVRESEVTDCLRQQTKQLCYGIIYGMGARTLAEQMTVREEEAVVFMKNFRNAYPDVQNYIHRVIQQCKSQGYVETIGGRKRFLATINDVSASVKSHAERQAVNTTIQGSAADLVKKVMIELDKEIVKVEKFRNFCNLVLHLHDELIYEVPVGCLGDFASLMKRVMETTVKLSVPFPVKIKSGRSWGNLTELKGA